MDIDIAARSIEHIASEHAVTLGLSGGTSVRIETSLVLTEAGQASMPIDPQNLETDQDLLRVLLGHTVEHAVADDGGSLTITFDNGATLTVAPDPDFEAWSITCPNGAIVLSLDGGGLSRWGARK
ncbi:DUF6188 family protein [Nocardioides sp. NPDC000445]|uniref:DUF6188 family protein n=1 Tax=Nocardioides sp. NPDC000445 TaxID=3154257 RepID=UPI00331A54BC